MDLYIYSDESGVFDKVHNDIFVFGGLIFLDKNTRDLYIRKYIHVEKVIRDANNIDFNQELKASFLNNKDKAKIYRSLHKCYKFGVIVHQKELQERIFDHKKSKQRYLDYAYKICVKSALNHLINYRIINPNTVNSLNFYVDEHNTATNGVYELGQGLEQELFIGTHNYEYSMFYKPILPYTKILNLQFCDSKTKPLVRAADIVANRIYHMAITGEQIDTNNNLFITRLP